MIVVVQQNIIAVMKHHGRVDTEASDTDIIHDLEAMVQSDVPRLLAASLGRVGFPYNVVAFVALPYCVQGVGYASLAVHDSLPVRNICLALLCRMNNGFVTVPLTIAVAFTVARSLAHDCRTWHTRSVRIVSATAFIFACGSLLLVSVVLSRALEGSLAQLGVFAATLALF